MKTIKRVSAAAAVLLVGFLSACAPATDRGEVIDKKHTDSYTYYQQQCYSRDKNGMCTYSVPMPVTVPEDFDIKVRDSAGTEAWLDVTEVEYNSVQFGDWYGPQGGN